jgi:hypothetical protein
MARAAKKVTIRLTPDQASLLYLNIDGWMDAGACEDGMTKDERAALSEACDQIIKGLGGKLARTVGGR